MNNSELGEVRAPLASVNGPDDYAAMAGAAVNAHVAADDAHAQHDRDVARAE